MISIKIDANDPYPLVDQIVDGIRRQIDERCLRPGTKLPSIRKFADAYGVSRFTAVEAYDRLVALGYLRARRGAGCFTASLRDELTPTSATTICSEICACTAPVCSACRATSTAPISPRWRNSPSSTNRASTSRNR